MPKYLGIFFCGLLKRPKCQIIHFFQVPVIEETALEVLSRLEYIFLFNGDLISSLKCVKDLILSAPSKSSVQSVLFSSVVLFWQMFDIMGKGKESSISLGFTPDFEVIFHVTGFFNTNENVTKNK